MRSFPCVALAALWVGAVLPAAAQAPRARTTPLRGSLEQRLGALLDQPPFDQATWGLYVIDERGRVLFQRNADRLFVPASNTKLVVTTAAAVLLPADYRVRTSVYANGSVADGVVRGDLVLYGRGDPTFSTRCYGTDTLAPGACDSATVIMGTLADSVRARGVRRVTGQLIGDGSYFEPRQLHPSWELFDATWWYAAPVSGLSFNDNSIDFRITPGPDTDAPPTITWTPDVGLATFENRARTGPADSASTIEDNFYRKPGTWDFWAEGTVAQGRRAWTENVAVPDPNLYAARALAVALIARGITVEGGAASTTDSLAYRGARLGPPLAERLGRPLGDVIFPILNSSQNTFAEYLLKILGREIAGLGSWRAGLQVERRFLTDVVGLDSTAFSLVDGSGLSTGNLVTPRALVRLLDYLHRHPRRDVILRGLPRPGQPGSMLRRFVGTALETRVAAKTGSITHVNSLSGYVERAGGRRITFSIQANSHTAPSEQILAQIDSVVVEIAR
jgi:D-alanyl-D-alanine carboxypeptidase/D-alanyl-D-alanine-endopeptidase (penicillin-binding protein 4)